MALCSMRTQPRLGEQGLERIMKITTNMNLEQLAERMSRDVEVSADVAAAMRDLLIEHGYDGQDTSDIPESEWMAMIDIAVANA